MSSRGGRQSMSELRYRRLLEHNQRLREDLARPRIRVSEAAASLIRYCKTTKDHLVPSVWGPVTKADDVYGQQKSGGGCCSIQ
ncbi:G-protein gamma subunit [Suillus clintonianus]|uniref:G-protein gamma subunit n=1 Tax=Suillus paluster TaxID=48578 RepID=UPI001B86B3F7|nr:G-protein gamma subunit [Suillus paluster]XP_041215915.1 G-protein gamma subunit [Suillus clintonianus]KAG0705093.1 G-protein gamma subunit [Suillus ampliporus]KAG1754384.1 G-protein gamma subunit [Suillus lakei]KAG1756404.1 G-protein gamma subunit [Suillus paluster]KAG2157466.1 G-protein gamma subunit [Suillus clintonianus]